jgi:hypothetical protein
MSDAQNKIAPEVCHGAVRMVHDHKNRVAQGRTCISKADIFNKRSME